jgi:flagellar assembly protein FliH
MRIERFDVHYLKDFFAPSAPILLAENNAVEEIPLPPPPPVFSQEELQAACARARQEGYDEGHEMGLVYARQQHDVHASDIALALSHMNTQLQAVEAMHATHVASAQRQIADLTLMIAKKMTARALNEDALPIIEALCAQCLPALIQKPQLTIEVSKELFDRVQPRIMPLLQHYGYEGQAHIRANDALSIHDVRLDWQSGQANRNTEQLWGDIERLVHHYITASPSAF